MTRRRTHRFATAALTLATAFAASTALAIAESNDSMSQQSVSSTDARYPSDQSMSAPDQTIDSRSLNASSDTDEDAMNSQDSSSDTDQDMDSNNDSSCDQDMNSNEDSSSDDQSSSSDDVSSPDVDSSAASAAGISSTHASSTTLDSSGSEIAEAPSENATPVSGGAVVMRTRPVYVFPPDQPRYTPETGDAQYGSKLDPEGPSANRFNDATGQ
jgi:hypothetical protein